MQRDEALRLAAHPLRERQVARLGRELLDHAHRVRRALRERARELERRVQQLRARHRLLDEPPVVGLRARDRVAAEVEVERAPVADEARQPLRAAAARDQAELDLRLAELRVLGRDPDVARHRELEPAAEAVAVDRGDDRRPARVHPRGELLDPAGGAALGGLLDLLAQRRELGDVGAGDERLLALAAEHDRARLVGAVEPVVLLLELLEQPRRERVHGRVVERDDRDAPVLLDLDELSHLSPLARVGLIWAPMRKAPSRRITSPFRYSFSTMCLTSAAKSSARPSRFGKGSARRGSRGCRRASARASACRRARARS